MLPDFVRVKERRRRWFNRTVQHEMERLAPLLKRMRTVQQHEGRRLRYETVEGDHDVVAYDNKLSLSLKIQMDEIARLGPAGYLAKAREMAAELAPQAMRHLFGTVERYSQEAGTAVDAGGKPFDPMMLLDGFEKMDLDFDEHGRPELPTFVMNPSQSDAFAKKMREAEQSPEFRRRWDEVMTRKLVEWRDREADRKLVE
jgi:hypothetical protein